MEEGYEMKNNIRHISESQCICDKCGEVFSVGILASSEHWAGCTGKEFMNEFKQLINKYDKI